MNKDYFLPVTKKIISLIGVPLQVKHALSRYACLNIHYIV